MARSLVDLVNLIDAPKSLVGPLTWLSKNKKLEASSSIEIDGFIEKGISFRASCPADREDEAVSIMLLTETSRRPRPFARIDWRGQIHVNTNKKICREYWGIDAGRTHFHNPRLHLHVEFQDLLENLHIDLPIAEKIDPDPSGFQQLLYVSGKLLGIDNLDKLSRPPWPSFLI